jgi:hypothetical protein
MTHTNTPPTTYTPTHTAEGRKLTRAERRAANKAAHAAMQAAKASERKPKRKPKPNSNDRMEARAQRESIRKQEGKRTKERAAATVVVGVENVKTVDGRIVGFEVGDAQSYERRIEVPAPPKQERKPLTFDGPDYADFDGLTLTEAANLAKAHWMADVTADDCL